MAPMMAASRPLTAPLEPPRTLTDVFRAEGAFVLRTVRRLGVEADDAEDLTQKVFLVLHRRPDLLEGGAPIRSVLFGVLRRVVADHKKGVRRARRAPLPELAVEGQQERAVGRREARARLEDAMGRLDDGKREVFVLYELEEMTMPEVAAALGIPLQTAYTRLHAACAIVRRALMKKGGLT